LSWKSRPLVEELEARWTPSLTLLSSTFYSSPDAQQGNSLSIINGNAYVAGYDSTNTQGLLLKYGIPPGGSPSNITATSSVTNLTGVSAIFNDVVAVGSAVPPAYGTVDKVGAAEQKAFLTEWNPANLTLTGHQSGPLQASGSTAFFPYAGSETFQAATNVTEGATPFFYVTGAAQSSSVNSTALLAKYDATGHLQWFQPIGLTGSLDISSANAVTTTNGNIYVAGQTQYPVSSATTLIDDNNANNTGSTPKIVYATPANWAQTPTNLPNNVGGTITSDSTAGDTATVTFSGPVITLYAVESALSGVAQVSIDGGSPTLVNLANSKTVIAPAYTSPLLATGNHTLQVTVISGSVSIDHFSVPPFPPSHAALWAYTPSGNLVYAFQDMVAPGGNFQSVTAVGSGLVAVGSTTPSAGTTNFLLEKFDSSGNVVWRQTPAAAGTNVLTGVLDIGTVLFACGYTTNTPTGAPSAVVLQIDPATGSVLSQAQFGGNLGEQASGLATDGTDLYVVGASRSHSSAGQNQIMLLRYGISASLTVTTASDDVLHSGLSLRDALAAANTNAAAGLSETISFDPSLNGQTIALTQGMLELMPGKGVVTINGGGQITIDGGGASSVFQVDSGATSVLSGLTIQNGIAISGGGINNLGTVTLLNSTLATNSCFTNGSALDNTGTATLSGCTLVGNTANSLGGGISNETGATLTLTNCTLSGNTATSAGGALYNAGAATLTNCTLSGNSANGGMPGGGGGIFNVANTLTLTNDIIANSMSEDLDNNGVVSGTNNLIQTAVAGPGSSNLTGTIMGDPKLGMLASNGGLTQTMALLTGSPAIDAGADSVLGSPLNLTTDQRGMQRKSGAHVDIGAFEVQPAATTDTFAVAQFSNGLWRHSDLAGWKQLTAASASLIAVDDHGNVAAVFSNGLWLYEDAGGWQRLTPAIPSLLDIGGNGIVAGEFPGNGLWRIGDPAAAGGGWFQLSSANAVSFALDDQGDTVASFQNTGVFLYQDATGWQFLSPAVAAQVSISVTGDSLAAVFQGNGVWRYMLQGGLVGWQQLTPAAPSAVSVGPGGVVVCSFGNGLWIYQNASGWTQLTPAVPSQEAIASSGEIFAEFPGNGVWEYTTSGWMQLSPADAKLLR
jgi:hypothetical protein